MQLNRILLRDLLRKACGGRELWRTELTELNRESAKSRVQTVAWHVFGFEKVVSLAGAGVILLIA
jgi:hypothetical protein